MAKLITGGIFENRSPANTDEFVGDFQKSFARNVDNAMAAARKALKKRKSIYVDFIGNDYKAQINDVIVEG